MNELRVQLDEQLRVRRRLRAAAAEGHDPQGHLVARQHRRQQEQPDPNQWVGWGDRTVDEMAHAWVNITYMSDEDFNKEVEKRKAKTSATTDRQQQ